MNKIYILRVSGGEYDDHWDRYIRAYSNCDLACKHCDEANEYLDKYIDKNRGRKYRDRERYNNPQDPLIDTWEYNLNYNVEEVDFFL